MNPEALFDALFDSQAQPMWVVDTASLRFLAVNEAALRLYGYTREEFLSLTADDIRSQEDIGDLRRAFADWSNNVSQRVWRHRKKSGDVMRVKVTSFSLDFAGHRARLALIEE